MRHLDLFAGIGGFSLAASWMGWKTVAQVEWDSWCQKVLAKNFPDALRFGDIKEFNDGVESFFTDSKCLGRTKGAGEGIQQQEQITKRQDIGNFCEKIRFRGGLDIITGGFPCQPFSHAGKRKGVSDERYLWPEMLRTIRIFKPSFVVGENVAGLVSMDNGKTLDSILADLENEGYEVESFVIPACAVGAWHRRDRIWIVAHSLDRSNRANGRQGRETENISCKCGAAGLSREFSGTNKEIFPDNNKGLQRGQEAGDTGSSREERDKQPERYGELFGGGHWLSEPSVGRVANGIPNRVDRLKGLGNAIVPQVSYKIFKAIELVFTK